MSRHLPGKNAQGWCFSYSVNVALNGFLLFLGGGCLIEVLGSLLPQTSKYTTPSDWTSVSGPILH